MAKGFAISVNKPVTLENGILGMLFSVQDEVSESTIMVHCCLYMYIQYLSE